MKDPVAEKAKSAEAEKLSDAIIKPFEDRRQALKELSKKIAGKRNHFPCDIEMNTMLGEI